ncbi:Retrovirus-related Pol polyprotein from transposon TNT 1-94 [Senna tora]|uniref:Retrovirus-related Pol polyprotein from transposon TNT 1-94 n=1 Tax=Senna tora TaxID=362788 RepID=A0A834WHK1_9FABA|nr:Retrovirus-related Pol polyprotein from transposon TNT 1-94 [Senna tora]
MNAFCNGSFKSIPEKDTAVDYLKAISEKFKKFDESQKAYYLSLLDNTLYDGVSGVREHMMKLVNYFNKLKSLKVDLGESYLVYKVLQSLPAENEILRTTYNSQEAEWSIDQMMSIVTQKEESLKKAKSCTHSVNNIIEGSSRKGGHEKYKGKKHQNKRSFGPKKDNKKDKGKMKKSFKVNTVTGHKRQRIDEHSSMLWHRRLGHISRDRLERMVKQDTFHDLDFSDFDSCVDCIKGKFSARARSKGASRSESILDLIHTDISGPISPATLGNYKYYITFIDDYSIYLHG